MGRPQGGQPGPMPTREETHPPLYEPSLEEIHEARQRIQESWSEAERRKRAPWAYAAEVVEVPIGIDRDQGFTIRTSDGEFVVG